MGPTAAVYMCVPLSGEHLDAIHGYLASVAEELEATRKGRVWQASVEEGLFSIAVEELTAVRWDSKADLAELGLCAEEAEWRALLSAPTHQPGDWQHLNRLAGDLAQLLGGHARPAICE